MTISSRVKEILADLVPLALEFKKITGKPLGVTGELAEFAAAETLGLELAEARTPAYDAIRRTGQRTERIQIKGRVCKKNHNSAQRLGRINPSGECDIVLLVLLDEDNLQLTEIWEAPFSKVVARLSEPGSKARNERGAMSLGDFKKLSKCVWPIADK